MEQEIRRIKELMQKLECLTDEYSMDYDIPIDILRNFQSEFMNLADSFEALSQYIKKTYKV